MSCYRWSLQGQAVRLSPLVLPWLYLYSWLILSALFALKNGKRVYSRFNLQTRTLHRLMCFYPFLRGVPSNCTKRPPENAVNTLSARSKTGLNDRFFVHFNGVFQTLFKSDFFGQILVVVFALRRLNHSGITLALIFPC